MNSGFSALCRCGAYLRVTRRAGGAVMLLEVLLGHGGAQTRRTSWREGNPSGTRIAGALLECSCEDAYDLVAGMLHTPDGKLSELCTLDCRFPDRCEDIPQEALALLAEWGCYYAQRGSAAVPTTTAHNTK